MWVSQCNGAVLSAGFPEQGSVCSVPNLQCNAHVPGWLCRSPTVPLCHTMERGKERKLNHF